MNERSYYETAEVLTILGVSRPTLGKYAQIGLLPKLRHGRFLAKPVDELAQCNQSQRASMVRGYNRNPAQAAGQIYAKLYYFDARKPQTEVGFAIADAIRNPKDVLLHLGIEGNMPSWLVEVMQANMLRFELLGSALQPEEQVLSFYTADSLRQWKSSDSRDILRIRSDYEGEVATLMGYLEEDKHTDYLFLDDTANILFTKKPRILYFPVRGDAMIDPLDLLKNVERFGESEAMDLQLFNDPMVGQKMQAQHTRVDGMVTAYYRQHVGIYMYKLRDVLARLIEDKKPAGKILNLVTELTTIREEYGIHPLNFADIHTVSEVPSDTRRSFAQWEHMIKVGNELSTFLYYEFL